MWFSAPFEFSRQVAQSVEQRIENPRVGGSIPSLATTFLFHPKPASTSAFQRTACRLAPGGWMAQAALERAALTLRFRPGCFPGILKQLQPQTSKSGCPGVFFTEVQRHQRICPLKHFVKHLPG